MFLFFSPNLALELETKGVFGCPQVPSLARTSQPGSPWPGRQHANVACLVTCMHLDRLVVDNVWLVAYASGFKKTDAWSVFG